MTFPVDLLGRPPIMRAPCDREEPETLFRRVPAGRAGRVRVLVPHVGNSSGVRMEPHEITLPAAPWEDKP